MRGIDAGSASEERIEEWRDANCSSAVVGRSMATGVVRIRQVQSQRLTAAASLGPLVGLNAGDFRRLTTLEAFGRQTIVAPPRAAKTGRSRADSNRCVVGASLSRWPVEGRARGFGRENRAAARQKSAQVMDSHGPAHVADKPPDARFSARPIGPAGQTVPLHTAGVTDRSEIANRPIRKPADVFVELGFGREGLFVQTDRNRVVGTLVGHIHSARLDERGRL